MQDNESSREVLGGRQAGVRRGGGRAARRRPIRAAGRDDRTASTERRLAEAERQLAEQRRTLAAEHGLAARLQQIILPIPDGPIVLPGLAVALRYLPAVQESFVGGDWYHAAELRDGSVLLASATWPGTAPRRPPRWRSCGTPCGRWPSPPRTRAFCSAC